MKKIPTCILFLQSIIIGSAQNWQWAHNAGGGNMNYPDIGFNILVNTDGKTYCLGAFADSILLDSLYTGGSFFAAKFNQEGISEKSVLFTHADNFSGNSTLDLSSDHGGHIFVCGQMDGGIFFGDTLFTGYHFGYVASFDTLLKCRWVKRVADITYTTCFDAEDYIYAAGTVSKANSFIDTFSLHNPDGFMHEKLFYAKLDATGNCQWVKQGYGGDCILGASVGQNHSLYFTGNIDSCAVVDTTSICSTASFATGILIKSDTSGKIIWHSECVTDYKAFFSLVKNDNQNNVYALGWLDSTLSIGGYTIQKETGHLRNMFLITYDDTGSVVWLKKIGCNTDAVSKGLYADASGNTYITATFSGTAIFGTDTVTAQSSTDMFITRFNTNGNCLGVKTVPNVEPKAITQDSSGNAIVTGSINMGTTYFDNIQLTCSGYKDFFIAKLDAINDNTSSRSLEIDGRLTIYPNPNNKTFTLVVPEGIVHANNVWLTIFDNTGKSIKDESVEITGNSVNVDIGTVNKGIYSVLLTSGHKKFTGRVVVE